MLVDAVVPQQPRLDAVVGGGLVEAHERVGVQPVAARSVPRSTRATSASVCASSVSVKAIRTAPAPTTR